MKTYHELNKLWWLDPWAEARWLCRLLNRTAHMCDLQQERIKLFEVSLAERYKEIETIRHDLLQARKLLELEKERCATLMKKKGGRR